MDNEITIRGLSTDKGKFGGFYNMGFLDNFCNLNKGKELIITVQVDDGDKKTKLIRKFHGFVVPAWRKSFFDKGTVMSIEETKEHIMKLSPITENIKSLKELGVQEIGFFLDHISNVSLEDHQLFMEDFRVIK